MNTRAITTTLIIGMLAWNSMPTCADEHPMNTYVGSPSFERLKHLAGRWKGTMDMGKGPMDIVATYKVTSNGSAVIETTFEGTPMEMITIYHDDSKHQLRSTHYCAIGNQPTFTLTAAKGDTLTFNLAPDADIDVAHETHMHAGAITFESADHMTQRWTKSEPGKPEHIIEVAFTRVP